MSGSTTQSLYSRDVLRLAMDLPHDDQLSRHDRSATRRSPLCGSEISVDVVITDGAVDAIAIRAKACVLGQASAAILRNAALGRTAQEIDLWRAEVHQALQAVGEMPTQWSALAYAREYPARHGTILLPFETLLQAML